MAFAAAGMVATACSLPFAPDQAVDRAPGEVVLHDGPFEVRLQLDRLTVARGGTFQARLTVRNTGATTETWTSGGGGCLAFLSMRRGGERIEFAGTDFVCLAVMHDFHVAPGETLEGVWPVTAATREGSVAPGAYLFQAEMISGASPGPHPTLTIPLRVR